MKDRTWNKNVNMSPEPWINAGDVDRKPCLSLRD